MTPRPLRVAVLFGGASVEHEVSVVSARGVAAALDPTRHACIPIAITGDGSWLPPTPSRAILEGGALRVETVAGGDGAGRVVAMPGAGLGVVRAGGAIDEVPVDVVFSVVHGWGGEDGRIQGLLDVAGIPYVGAGVLGSAAGMDKWIAKEVFAARGIPVTPWLGVSRDAWPRDAAALTSRIDAVLGYPAFVKPANGGSSVGITKVGAPRDLEAALDRAFRLDRRVIVERGVDAREIEVAVLGNATPEASVAGEIVPSREFYDYAAKYEDGTSRLLIPAPIPPLTAARVRSLAVEAFRALDLAGLARVDFFLDRRTGDLVVNEVNTLPGFTPISMYPKLWEATGVPYPELLARLIGLALDRFQEERRRATRREVHGG